MSTKDNKQTLDLKRKPEFESVADIFERVRKNVELRTGTPEMPFGIAELDEVTHGIRRGKLTVLAARTSEGKTTLGIQTAFNIADTGKMVAYISLEDDREQLVEKLFCNVFSVHNWSLICGNTEKTKDPAIQKIFERLRMLVLDDFGYTFDEIRFVVEQIEPKPDIVFIDYIQMIDSVPGMNRTDIISEFSRKAKIYAEKENVAIVLLSQINREGAKEGRPRLHHLAGSGSLEQVADLALLLYLPARYNAPTFDYEEGRATEDGKKVVISGYKYAPEDWMEIEIAKNKCGQQSIVPARFIGRYYQIKDWVGSQSASEEEARQSGA